MSSYMNIRYAGVVSIIVNIEVGLIRDVRK